MAAKQAVVVLPGASDAGEQLANDSAQAFLQLGRIRPVGDESLSAQIYAVPDMSMDQPTAPRDRPAHSPPDETSASPPSQPPSNNSRRNLIIAAVVGIIVLLFLFFFLRSGGGPVASSSPDATPRASATSAPSPTSVPSETPNAPMAAVTPSPTADVTAPPSSPSPEAMLVPVGAVEQDSSLKAMVGDLNRLLGNRLGEQVEVILQPAAAMPKRPDGGRAFGLTKPGRREIWLWDAVDRYPAAETLAHEAMHVLDVFWLTDTQRNEIMELMTPSPSHWEDRTIGQATFRYAAMPHEVFAVYASAAIVGFDRPAFRSLYERRIDEAKWDSLARVVLRDTDDGPRGLYPWSEGVPAPPE